MSEKRSCQNSSRLKKQTFSCSTKAKLHFPVSHMDRHQQENHSAQQLSLSTPVFLSAIRKYVTNNILELVGNESHNNRRIRRAVDNAEQLSHLFEDDNQFSG
ncbi:PREDICTED: histone H2A-Bbd type 1-like [Ceratotherium simum simum]|uniref:Histone H2A n=1 Tax=Ceratotherium simum simum TaxID=73337 RepID=A0ABM0I6X9_CERSS|nr:PREDICTED: histone H2A-Bbd type 1-like [Ceratotherium simum simum]